MTQRELKRILRVWMRRLGVSHWRLTVSFDGDPTEFVAQTVMGDYDYALLRFSVGWHEWDEFHANQTIVHELLHLVTRDLDHATDEVLPLLGKQARLIQEARLKHEFEGLVDRLATVFVELAGLA